MHIRILRYSVNLAIEKRTVLVVPQVVVKGGDPNNIIGIVNRTKKLK